MAAVVRIVAVLLDVLPICAPPLYVVNANVPVKEGVEAMAASIADRCAVVSVTVLFDVPVDVCAGIEIVVIVVEPFFTASS